METKFKKGDKVIAIPERMKGSLNITGNKVYEVVSCYYSDFMEDLMISITGDDGKISDYMACRFKIAKEKTLEEQLEESKKETARLEKLIADKTPKVGDKYHFDGAHSFRDAVMMLAESCLGGTTYYSLIILECPNSPSDIGKPWISLTTNINDVFGGQDTNRFTKL